MRLSFLLIAASLHIFGGLPSGEADAGPLMPPRECSSIVLKNHGSPVFGTNLDHVTVDEGLVFVNKRWVEKTGLYPSADGEHARWISRYASITFNLVGFQFAWAGMNEKGLTLSTMSLNDTEVPALDERPPLDSGEWMQLVLDTCATVEDLVATDARVSIITVDHYLIADSLGNCAVVEFLNGEMVVHTLQEMPASVLTNSIYSEAVATWLQFRDSGDYSGLGSSLERFCLAADRARIFSPGSDEWATAYAFDTLEIIRGEDFSIHTSQWSIVFDTLNLRVYFRTAATPEIRYVDLETFDLGCESPVQMLDIQEPLTGDVGDHFFDFSYDINFEHIQGFMDNWGIDISTYNLHRILRHFETFPCVARRPRRPSGRSGYGP
ncbi:MAG: hypothetical protein DRJ65_02230 [Acidobacteria bacterium]|nr:MAG: hypothetical protein DRJ65_02230 [Acidobacteriota bacterium]